MNHSRGTDEACSRIRADFEEMPDLAVNIQQAARFWAVDEDTAAAALTQLERLGYLRRSRRGFRRA